MNPCRKRKLGVDKTTQKRCRIAKASTVKNLNI